MRLKLAIACEFPTLNGGEQSMMSVLRELSDREIEPVVLAPAEGALVEVLRNAGIEHVPFQWRKLDGTRPLDNDILFQWQRVHERYRPQLLHANSLSISRLIGALADRITIPVTGHLRDIIKLSQSAVGHINRLSQLVAVSGATRDFHVSQGLDAARTVVIHNGIDPLRFHPHHRETVRHSILRELNLPNDVQLAITIGQICLRKGHDLLAAAAIALRDRLPNLHFVVVGERYSAKPESIEFERRFRAEFERSGMDGRLHWLGYRDDIPQLLCAADVVVHPARQEPLGRVLLEAIACGRPIVAACVGGTPEIVTHERSALLFPVGKSVQLADSIERVLTTSSLKQELELGSLQEAQRFRIADKAQQLYEFWRSAIMPPRQIESSSHRLSRDV